MFSLMSQENLRSNNERLTDTSDSDHIKTEIEIENKEKEKVSSTK